MADLKNNTSISQQIDSAASSATNIATGGQLSSIGSKFDETALGLAKGLLNAGSSIAGAAKNAIGQLGVLSTATKFADTLTAPKKIPDVRPEQTKGRLLKGPESMQYPLDLGHYYIKFSFFEYKRSAPTADKQTKPTATIFMPLPGELSERFGVQYADRPLGVFGILEEAGVFAGAADALRSGNTQAMNDAIARGTKIAMDPKNITAIAGTASGLADTAVGAGVQRAAGAILNPYQALTFQGTELRTHSFRFKCSPNSESEAAALKKIVTTFKRRMLPQKSGLLYNFPDFCTIEFASRDVPYSFKNCYLKNMSVNYAPSGTPAFFKGGKYAAEVEIQLEFGEIEPVTRNDLEKGSDITGQYGEAYSKSGVAISTTPSAADPTKNLPSRSAPVATPRTSNDQGVTGLQSDTGVSFGVGGLSG